MLKYHSTYIGFREVPDEVSLCINISGCMNKCEGCHSPYLRENVGDPLNINTIDAIIEKNEGITCIAFMGGDHEWWNILELGSYIKANYDDLKTAWYSGKDEFPNLFSEFRVMFDYLKIGSYNRVLGPLDSPTTNQKMYQVNHVPGNPITDITYKFKKQHETEN
jgi:anaerobic ribonucleoside-triphosphate reductase activating protein